MRNSLSINNIFREFNKYAPRLQNINSFKELAAICSDILDDFFDPKYTAIYLVDAIEERLNLYAAKGFSEEERLEAEKTAMERHPGKVLKSGETLYIPDTDLDLSKCTVDSKRSFVIKSRLFTPVVSNGKVVGTFGIVSEKKNAFNEHDIEVLSFITNMAGIFYASIKGVNKLREASKSIEFLSKFPTENPNPILRISLDYVLNYANKASTDLLTQLGLKEGKEIHGELRSLVSMAIKTKKIHQHELSLNNSFYLLIITPVKDAKYVNIYGTNISERKHIENELKKASLIAEKTDNAVVITDEKGITEWVNDGFTKMSGYSREEIIGFQPGEILQGPDTDLSTVKQIEKALEKKKSIEQEILNYTKDGKPYWIKMQIQPIFDNDGKLTNFISIQSDITEKKLLEDSRKASEDIIRSILKNSLDGVIVVDSEGKIVDWNNQAELIFGYTREEAIDNKLNKLIIPEEYQQAHKDGMRRYVKTGKGNVINKRIEITAKHKSGKIFSIELAISPIKLANQIHFSAFVRDITERKKHEEELAKAKAMAENANLAKSQFLANMSHEIRTPMNAVHGISKLLEDTNLDNHQFSLVDKLNTSATNLLTIINDVLDFSKIESGILTLEKISFNFQELIAKIVTAYEFRAEEKSSKLKYSINENIPVLLKGDQVRLRQIIINLVSNSIKFTEDGCIDIICSHKGFKNGVHSIEISVADTGIGIDEKSQKNIFKSFQQEDDSVTRKYGGTGLGLSISKQLVELMGGNISVKSKKGEGSTFSFTIDLEEGKKEELENDNQLVIDRNTLKGKRILYAEDNEFNKFIGESILTKWNIIVDLADDGEQAIELMKNNPYDLILMDLQMPNISGYEASKYIRTHISKDIPIIALTADVVKGTIDKCKKVGINDYVSKPFEHQVLYSKLIHYLGVTAAENKTYKDNKQSVEEKVNVKETLFNLENLRESMGNDESQINMIIEVFIDVTPEYLSELNNNYFNGNLVETAKSAHKIKSSLQMIATEPLNKTIGLIEKYALQNKSSDKLSQLIEEFNSDIELLIEQLKNID